MMLAYGANVFSGQTVHLEEARGALRKDPAGQAVQLDAPDAFAKKPAAQGCKESEEA